MNRPEAWMIAGAELVDDRGRAWVYRFANGRGIAVAAGAVAGLLVGKGDAAEREVAAIISELTGWPARRMLGAGRSLIEWMEAHW